jgi:pyruvate dehydrogenase E2 component (dihydrolipoamide acetyltransferase)
MAKEIVMPQMGAEMEEGTILHWTKQVGDFIARGETIGEIETDKATVDLESFDEGYFLGASVADGTTVPVGTVIGFLGAQGEAMPAGAGGSPAAAPAAASEPAGGQAQAQDETPAADAAEAPAAATAARQQGSDDAAATPSQQGGGAARPEGQPVARETGAEPVTDQAAPDAEAQPAAPADGARPAAAAPAGAGAATTNGAQAAPGVPATTGGGRLRVSPVARGIAEELGIDLTQVRGSGPDGRIMRRDVEQFAQARGQAPAAAPVEAQAQPAALPAEPVAAAAPAARDEPAPTPTAAPTPPTAAPQPAATAPAPTAGIEPLSRMRQAIARRMAAAKREIPHYYVTMTADMTEAMALRKQLNAALGDEGQKLSVNDLIVKACALALEKHPRFNMSFAEEGLKQNAAINISIAVALDDGLIVPAVLNCQGKSLGAIARESHDVAERARSGKLRQAEIADGTFTVSNLGMYGVETLIAIIQPGQSAILGVGKVEPRPAVRDGEVVVRDQMTIALSADHRVSDGAQGARFLAEIKDLLEHPVRLVL